MKNVDNLDFDAIKSQKSAALQQVLAAATKPEEIAESLVTLMVDESVRVQGELQKTMAEYRKSQDEQWDSRTLAARGVYQLTSTERKAYQKAVDAYKARPKATKEASIAGFNELLSILPATVHTRVFDNLATEHPVLSRITFLPAMVNNFVVYDDSGQFAFWGKACRASEALLEETINSVNVSRRNSLTGYIAVCNALFELPVEWLDRFIRQLLEKIIARSLEKAVVDGEGQKEGEEQPVGMTRTLADNNNPRKTPIVLTNLSPATIGSQILAPATLDGTRDVPTGVALLLNPVDYFERFFALGAYQTNEGVWVFDKFPVPNIEVLRTSAVPKGLMVAGVLSDYVLAAGEAKIDTSSDVKFLDNETVYRLTLYADGRPVSEDAFTLYDISAVGTPPTGISPPKEQPEG